MIRVLWFSLLIPIALVLLWDDAPSWAIQVAFFGSLAAIVFGLLTNRLALKCPHCHKRVKLGASTCHHCGAQVANPRPLTAPRQAALTPEQYTKVCSHCMSDIHPEAVVCPHCQRDVQKWTLHDGRWWTRATDTGEWLWLDDVSQWQIPSPGQSVPSPAVATAGSPTPPPP